MFVDKYLSKITLWGLLRYTLKILAILPNPGCSKDAITAEFSSVSEAEKKNDRLFLRISSTMEFIKKRFGSFGVASSQQENESSAKPTLFDTLYSENKVGAFRQKIMPQAKVRS